MYFRVSRVGLPDASVSLASLEDSRTRIAPVPQCHFVFCKSRCTSRRLEGYVESAAETPGACDILDRAPSALQGQVFS